MSKNFLVNPGFNEGHHHQDGIAEIVVPDGWHLHWLDRAPFVGSQGDAARPESVVWNIVGAPEHEKDVLFLEGEYCLKVFKSHAPMYFALTQHVKGLTPGETYRFTVPIFPDLVQDYTAGGKKWADDPWAGEVRLGWSAPNADWPAGEDGAITWSDWFNVDSGTLEFGQYNRLAMEFRAPGSGEVRVWIEAKAKWGLKNNGWFLDALSLVNVPDELPPPTGLVSIGVPAHVKLGDRVTVVGTSTAGHTSIELKVIQPSGDELPTTKVQGDTDGDDTWTWTTDPVKEKGQHRCDVTANGQKLSTAWFMAGDGEPPAVGFVSSKLGPHVLRRKEGDGLDEWLAKAPVVKLCGEWGLADTDKIHPNALVIGRVHSKFNAGDQRHLDPAAAARRFVDSQLDTYEANPGITYWEGHNEPVWSTPEDMTWYAKFEIARMKLMDEDHKLKCVIGNFSVGQPELKLWPYFLPAMEAALRYEAILGLHEYSSPWMWWMYGEHQVDPTADQGDEGWLTCRYRKVYRNYFIPNGVGKVPLVITECGCDTVAPVPSGAKAGSWKTLWSYWRTHDGKDDPEAYYVEQLRWYEDELKKDDYVLGATVFTCGYYKSDWKNHDISNTPVIRKLTEGSAPRSQPFTYQTALPPPQPAVAGRGAPREQYERTYILLPPNADWLWCAAIAAATEGRAFTLGSSADDAGVGDLAVRRVIAINPKSWPDDLGGFFKKYYPGVEYIPLLDTESPSEAAVLLRPVTGEHALCQRDPRWKDADFGEQPGGYSIGEQGCLLTGFAMILRRAYGRDVTPPILDRLLTLDRRPYVRDIELVDWKSVKAMFPIFDDTIKFNRAYSAAELQQLHEDGWEIVLRVDGGDHFVLYEAPNNDESVWATDPWDGKKKVRPISDVCGIRAAHIRQS